MIQRHQVFKIAYLNNNILQVRFYYFVSMNMLSYAHAMTFVIFNVFQLNRTTDQSRWVIIESQLIEQMSNCPPTIEYLYIKLGQ